MLLDGERWAVNKAESFKMTRLCLGLKPEGLEMGPGRRQDQFWAGVCLSRARACVTLTCFLVVLF